MNMKDYTNQVLNGLNKDIVEKVKSTANPIEFTMIMALAIAAGHKKNMPVHKMVDVINRQLMFGYQEFIMGFNNVDCSIN